MGYRSEVALIMKQDLANDLIEYILQITSVERDDIQDLLDSANSIVTKDYSILYYWNFTKWYLDSPGIIAIYKLLRNAPEKTYLLLRLGEEVDDIETLGSFYDNPFDARIAIKLDWHS